MYCSHCGKELAETAIVCPNCGTPTSEHAAKQLKGSEERNPLIISGFTMAIITFVIGFVWMVTALATYNGSVLMALVVFAAILPAFCSLTLSICGLCKKVSSTNKALGITAVVLSGFIIFMFFIAYMLLVLL